MYNSPDIDNIDYLVSLSVSRFPSYCINERVSVTSTVNQHISSTVIYSDFIFCYNGTYDIHYCASIKHFAKTSRCCPH